MLNLDKDIKSPYLFKEWSVRNKSLSQKGYENYLKEWNKTKDVETQVVHVSFQKDLYISLIERLNILFAEDPEIIQIKITDFTDDVQIKNAIPIYAKKLVNIAKYYRRRRDYLQSAYKRYSMRNTNQYMEHMLYNYFHEIVTDKTTQDEGLLRCFQAFEDIDREDVDFWNPVLAEEYYFC